MLYLYFEDCSQFTFMLDQKHLEHGGRLIKTYTSPFDPRQRLNNPNLAIIETDDSPLNNILFNYKDRGIFSGQKMEENISTLNPYVKRGIRGLLRFSNRGDLRFCQTGMAMKKDGNWLIDNPLEDIDGIEKSLLPDKIRLATLHLDIFNADSLKRLSEIMDTSVGSKEFVDWRVSVQLKKDILAEISGSKTERKA